ncbi:biotin/lipoyl attachment domain-containing protein [Striga hermonthica]|uniref:Biotin/lipoyl attachment domain-containing protein n=1 Tax=Striga hermonthica TaxID=68872 RepID=A0A9N7NIJ2_STRHE|nr:biotin/lipoyl attachment domain-containing protein [Striga hermonthica]
MESATLLRSFNITDAASTCSRLRTVIEKPGMLIMNTAAFSSNRKFLACRGSVTSFKNRNGYLFVSCVKTSDTTLTAKSNGDPNGAVLSESQQGAQGKKTKSNATFPNGFEALLKEVCDETEIAELKLKVGTFEIHMKRKIDGPAIPAPVAPQASASPVPSKTDPTPVALLPVPNPSSEKVSPFTNVSVEKAAKLAALEVSGSSSYVIVPSPTVGSFRRATKRKGRGSRPACKEGDMIEEGQVIGFLDQFGRELPVTSSVAGEVLKFLYIDGEAVGYGDPLIAVLPSFHGIK